MSLVRCAHNDGDSPMWRSHVPPLAYEGVSIWLLLSVRSRKWFPLFPDTWKNICRVFWMESHSSLLLNTHEFFLGSRGRFGMRLESLSASLWGPLTRTRDIPIFNMVDWRRREEGSESGCKCYHLHSAWVKGRVDGEFCCLHRVSEDDNFVDVKVF